MSASAAVPASHPGQRPIGADLFHEWPSPQPRLRGARCPACTTVVFPVQDGCPRCGAAGMEPIALGTRGTLWTWTTQDFLPKAPYGGTETEADFAGYLVGYVELPEGLRVVTRLVGVERDDVAIGMDLELTTIPFGHDPDGTEVIAYGFRPAGPAQGAQP